MQLNSPEFSLCVAMVIIHISQYIDTCVYIHTYTHTQHTCICCIFSTST